MRIYHYLIGRDPFTYSKMPVKIRLARRGRKKKAMYDVVVADSRSPRDGRFIEKIGIYNPNTNPATVEINNDSALKWVMNGAQPTDTVRAMLSYRGVMFRKHLEVGVAKGAISQTEADEKYQKWLDEKTQKIQQKIDKLGAKQDEEAKTRLEAEMKINQARIDEQLAKKKAAEEALKVEIAEENTTEKEKELIEEGSEATEKTE